MRGVLAGTHAVVISMLRHPVTGAIMVMMFVLGMVGWLRTYVG